MSSTARTDVRVPGGSLATFRMGGTSEQRDPVLAIHGITSSSHTWVAVARALDGDVSLLAPDLRGRGRSNGLSGPYGMAAHAEDMLAVLDHFGIERAVVAGHSLGAYIAARLAVDHPERVRFALLVDGGLTIPGSEGADPQEFADAFLGLALGRLKMTFPSREAYHDWWRAHPAFTGSDIDDADLVAYANHDLVGTESELRSAVMEEAVRGDAAELVEMGRPAQQLTVDAQLLCAPRGLVNDPRPMQPIALGEEWATGAPERRTAIEVPDVNHFTSVLSARGARTVVGALTEQLAIS